MLGVMVLILVISVMTGFDRELRQKVIDFDAHILVTSEDVMRDWRALKTKVDKTPGVVATAPYVQGPVIVEFHNRRLAPVIRGVDPQQEEKVIPLQKFIKIGKLDLEGESTVLGIELARKLGAREVEVINDSELVARQIGGQYKVKNAGLKPLFLEALKELRGFDRWSVRNVRREDNTRADELVNEALDARG